jgi:hypothetical protein
MARAKKKKPRIKVNPCIGPARNLAVLEGSISSSVDVDSVKKASLLYSISWGLVSCGRSDVHQCHPCCVGPAINFTVLEGSISCSVQFNSVKKASLDSVSCGLVSCSLVSCGLTNAHQCHPCCVGPAIN